MKAFARRRVFSLLGIAIAAILILIMWYIEEATVTSRGFLSGWVLGGMIVVLASYNIRKRLPFLPLGSSALWLQFHIYLGLLSVLLFAIHVGFAIPNGWFELLLAGSYLLVFVSGLIGLYMTRSFPKRLNNFRQEVIFETIPVIRRELNEKIEALMVADLTVAGQTEIPEFYRDSIRPFLTSRPAILAHLRGASSKRWLKLQRDITDQRRFMNEAEKQTMNELQELLAARIQLDIQYVLQGSLKLWLFVHIPATAVLMIFAFFHSVLVHAWMGAMV